MDGMSFWYKAEIFVLSNFALIVLVLPIFLILLGLGWGIKSGIFNRVVKWVGLLVPAIFLSVTALLLLDNFTYTVLKFGIVSTAGFWRGAYGVLFILFLFIIFRKIHSELEKNEGFFNSSGLTYIIAATLIFSLVLAGFELPGTKESSTLADTSGVTRKPNIIILGSDGLNASNMSVYGYDRDTTPYLKELSKESLVAENQLTNSGNSSGSVISIFTGKLPSQTRVIYPPDILQSSDSYQHLPGILKQLGYHTIEISVPHYLDSYTLNLKDGFDEVNQRSMDDSAISKLIRKVLPDDVMYFLGELGGRVFDRLDHIFYIRVMPNLYQDILQPTENLDDKQRLAELTQIIQQSNQPFFVHVHLMGTHGGQFSPASSLFSGGEAQNKDWMTDYYDDAIYDFDGYVQQVVNTLKQTGKLDNTILIIYSDHAQQWLTNNRIPLIIRFPNAEHTGTLTNDTQNLDISPTILDYMGISIPKWMGGESLLGGEPAADRPIYGAGVGNNEEMGNGLWFYNLDTAKPPFFQFGFFSETVCQNWVKLDTTTKQWTNGTLYGDTTPCQGLDAPSLGQMESDLLNQLKKDGFNVSSVKLSN